MTRDQYIIRPKNKDDFVQLQPGVDFRGDDFNKHIALQDRMRIQQERQAKMNGFFGDLSSSEKFIAGLALENTIRQTGNLVDLSRRFVNRND